MKLNTRRYKVIIAVVSNNTNKITGKDVTIYAQDVLDACSKVRRDYALDNSEDISFYSIISVMPIDPVYGIEVDQ